MSIKKRIVSVISAIAVVAGSLCGCQGMTLKTEKPAVLAIPSNGIVTSAQLESIKKSGKAVTYKGAADGVNYEWTFVGSQIKDVGNVNLKVSFKTKDDTVIAKQAGGKKYLSLSFAQKGRLAGTPTLAIVPGKSWSDGTYYFYSGGKNPSNRTKTTATVNPGLSDKKAAAGSTSSNVQGLTPSYVCNTQLVNGICHFNLQEVYGEYFITEKSLPATGGAAASSAVSASSPQSSASGTPNSSGSQGMSGQQKKAEDTPRKNGASSQSGPSIATKNADPGNINVPDANGNNYDNGYGNGHPAPWTDPPQDKSRIVGNVTFTIRCDTAVSNWNKIRPNKKDNKIVPANGVIYATHTLPIYKNETVYDMLISICEKNNMQEEHSFTPAYKAEYIRGINNLYEFDVGQLSGWMYSVNGWYPNYGCSRYVLQNGDSVQWNYTCDLGRDLGQNWIG